MANASALVGVVVVIFALASSTGVMGVGEATGDSDLPLSDSSAIFESGKSSSGGAISIWRDFLVAIEEGGKGAIYEEGWKQEQPSGAAPCYANASLVRVT